MSWGEKSLGKNKFGKENFGLDLATPLYIEEYRHPSNCDQNLYSF